MIPSRKMDKNFDHKFRPQIAQSASNQLVSITHEIYSAFDCNSSLEIRGVFEVQGVFLDLFIVFDRV